MTVQDDHIKLTQGAVRTLVYSALNTAINENGYKHLLTMTPDDVIDDMKTYGSEFDNVGRDVLKPVVVDYLAGVKL